jgi:hypothetical protein
MNQTPLYSMWLGPRSKAPVSPAPLARLARSVAAASVRAGGAIVRRASGH